MMILNAALQRH